MNRATQVWHALTRAASRVDDWLQPGNAVPLQPASHRWLNYGMLHGSTG